MIIEATPSIYIKDQSLSDEVQAWIDAGNKVSKIESKKKNLGEIVAPMFNNCSQFDAHRKNLGDGLKGRSIIQKPLLEKYKSVVSKKTCWLDMSKAVGGCVSSTHLSRTAKGKTSIQDNEVWNRVKAYAEQKIKEWELRNEKETG
ncbi:MAG TPA: hypothetical protein VIG45_06800 [Erysipelothrix sp.]